MNCAIYCRYSDSKQDGGYSIEAQRDACLDYAANHGYSVVRVFEDKALSGTNDLRKSFQEMIALAMSEKKSPFAVLLVHNTNRFARNRFDSVKYKHMLKLQGVKVLSVTQGFVGTGTPEDVIFEGIFESLDEYYSKNLSRETLKGMRVHIEKGYWKGGNPPFGYALDSGIFDGKQRSRLIVNDFEAQLVRKIYKLYLEGYGYISIMKHLDNLRADYGVGRFICRNQVARILQSRVYVGDTVFSDILFEHTHPAIIEKSVFEQVQDKMKRKIGKTPVYQNDYLLSGIIKCHCGSAMTGVSAKNNQYHYYQCGASLRRNKCEAKRITARKIEDAVIKAIKTSFITKESVTAFVRSIFDSVAENRVIQEASEKELRASIADHTKRLHTLQDLIETGKAFPEDFRERMTELRGNIQSASDKLDSLAAKKLPSLNKSDIKHILGEYVKLFTAFVESDDFARSKNRIHEILREVRVGKESIKIVWSMPEKQDLEISTLRSTNGSLYGSGVVLIRGILTAHRFTVQIPRELLAA
jgi:DNA invertase Pin-like site-specific DNA recombinase